MQGQTTPSGYLVLDEILPTRASKWHVPVILHLRRETRRFSELQREIGVISQKALTASLRSLERDGFVSRTSYATIPPRVDYALTELGMEILMVFEAFEAFSTRNWRSVVEAREVFDSRPSVAPGPAAMHIDDI
jgi:DNA-binding HxlR family transcriptional regulator